MRICLEQTNLGDFMVEMAEYFELYDKASISALIFAIEGLV
jgi:hypothetical protein